MTGEYPSLGRHAMILGTYHDLIFERSTHDGPVPDNLVIGDTENFVLMRPLLTADDHAHRLEAGDQVLALMIGDRPAALQWLNCSLHQDRYLGSASRPTAQVAYINQAIVDPEFRNRGLMRQLMQATMPVAFGLGFARVRAFVDTSNAPMIKVMEGVGFAVIGWQRGVRIGSRFTLRHTHPAGPAEGFEA